MYQKPSQFLKKQKKKWDDDEQFDKCIFFEEEDIERHKSFCSEENPDINQLRATDYGLYPDDQKSATAAISSASPLTENSRLSIRASWRETEVQGLRKSDKQHTDDSQDTPPIKKKPFKLGRV